MFVEFGSLFLFLNSLISHYWWSLLTILNAFNFVSKIAEYIDYVVQVLGVKVLM